MARMRRSIEKGETIANDDITDITLVNYKDIEIPPQCAVVAIFPVGWKRGVFYDMHPILRNKTGEFEDREYEIPSTFASLYNYMNYSYLFGLSEQGWQYLFGSGWFLFNGLKHDQLKEIAKRAELGQNFEVAYLDTIATDLETRLPRLLDAWHTSPSLSDHIEIIARATERYLAKDYISVSSIVYPRIEGIMRSFHLVSKTTPISQRTLSNSLVDRHFIEHRQSLLLPEKFRDYLSNVYFASFDPNNPTGASRNTISHGVAPISDLNLKTATIGILTLEQIANFILGEKGLSGMFEQNVADGIEEQI